VEFADELVDGIKGAALPGIQHTLGLGYAQLGLLTSVPLILGGLLELPLGLVAGTGRRRRLVVLGGGALFVLTIAAVAFARDFGQLLAAMTLFFPASGAFVSLTQASLMDTAPMDTAPIDTATIDTAPIDTAPIDTAPGTGPERQARLMAWWDMAGWAGAVCGPLLLVALFAVGGGWRDGYLVAAALSATALCATALSSVAVSSAAVSPTGSAGEDADGGDTGRAGLRELGAGARRAARWLVLLEVADLLVDVLTGFVAVYLVDVTHASPAAAALVVAVRLGAGLAADALLVLALRKISDLTVLRATAVAAAALYPAFLLVPGLVPKLATLAVLSAATATWYPLLQARLYGAVPSPVAVTLSTAAGLAGGLGPLGVGMAAAEFGLPWALATLAVVPVLLLAGTATHDHEQRAR
jgi:MFS transporter, FSR family, fosmidomycin resistance protein